MTINELKDSTETILNKDLPTTKPELKTQYTACMSLTAQILVAKTHSHEALLVERERFRHPKDKELTDLDRNTMLQASTADLQADFELLSGLYDLLILHLNTLTKLI